MRTSSNLSRSSARPGFFSWLRASLSDRVAWQSVAYFVAKVPLTLLGVWFALSTWIEALFGITSPLTGSIGPQRFGPFGRMVGPGGGPPAPGFGTHVGVFIIGVVFLFVAPWTMRLVVYVDRRMMHAPPRSDAADLAGPSLEESRSKTSTWPRKPSSGSSAICTTVPKPSWSPWPCGSVRPRRSSNT